MMRIIAGEFRSRVIQAPRGWQTRPTSDRLRETLFNVLGDRVVGACFLDLYAGSGANGLEALSRGAARAMFVEQARTALEALAGNIAALGVANRAEIVPASVVRWLQNTSRAREAGTFDLLFLDPPYAAESEYTATLEALGTSADGLLAPGALVIAEHRRVGGSHPARIRREANDPLAECYGALRRTRLLTQGDAALSFYQNVWSAARLQG